MPKKTKEEIILGIDPGLATTGFGIIVKTSLGLKPIRFGTINTSPKKIFAQRLKIIHDEMEKILIKYKPDFCAVESIYFCKNAKTALLVGQARGVVLLTCIKHQKPLLEFTPLQIKQAITSYGKAEKKQMQQMVKVLLKLKDIPTPDDAADALACAICAANSLATNSIS
ncbi:crossover junction endodeoxyribonuclease RuvC [Candidatus Parcubacteria bacterium]|nr:MAG: crossover junction endodeoxyribonuclease RuvC [Candidatus Parcubacteria bacterium]